ncbi:hypothetical protein J2W17_001667 [Pseudomonas lini]|uniref:hypothetical protein n=1 Tax=Pseudomonas lini TaxID=163011 RepID=UPI00278219EB|nr:hypothetical protein [Pseudomonas lini]MDQ0122722.1 hypothetical protein [Pseudomonas lini]
MLAMDANDYAFFLDKRVALETIVGTPPGASSLLQGESAVDGLSSAATDVTALDKKS